VIVLDDPMSAVDTETERHLVENLRPAVAGRTVLVSGQRLSTILVPTARRAPRRPRRRERRAQDLIRRGGAFTELFGDEALAA
jgi:ATP-binding cassette subfamily B protein